MDVSVGGSSSSSATQSEEQMELRRGPWTIEEDLTLINYITNHGEGRWNSLARCAGLKRTGKSCRLRWLNYLRPDVRRGNITLEEQLLILELHSRWGNRWSKIAQHLPGRTDNEIKNYWRTRVQKHAKQLQCDVKSKQFKDTMRYQWMPRLVEKIRAAAAASSGSSNSSTPHHNNNNKQEFYGNQVLPAGCGIDVGDLLASSSDCVGAQTTPVSVSDHKDYYSFQASFYNNVESTQSGQICYPECLTSPSGYINNGLEFHHVEQNMWLGSEDVSENLWNVDDMWLLQQRLYSGI